MIEVNDLFITFCPDCGDNVGGFYCQVYNDKNYEEIDNFVIPKEECNGDLSKAEEYAKQLMNMNMVEIEKQFVQDKLKEICENFCYSAYDIEKIVDAVIDDVITDIKETADIEFNCDDVKIGFTRVLLKKLYPECSF
jgi:hypothetical protein